MSKIWKKPIIIPDGVEVTIEKNLIKVKWPKWELSYNFLDCVNLKKEGNELIVEVLDEEKRNIWGLTRTLISNMVEWVTNWYEKKLLVTWVWYLAKLEWNKLILSLGLSHKVNFEVPKDIQVAVEQDPKWNSIIILKSIDKQNLWEVAANIRFLRPPEPYKWKWIRYINEFVKLKAGKSAKK